MQVETKDIPQHVPLHLHTEYSLLDGASRIKDIVKKAKLNNMPAIAVTDHGVVYGALELYKTATSEGIKPIIGCEVYIVNGDHHDRSVRSPLYHLILLAKNDKGYINLSKIVTESNLKGFYYKPRINKEFLKKHSSDLIALTACLGGEVPNIILSGQYERAREIAEFYKSIFKDDFYLEIQDHKIPEEKYVNPLMVNLSKELKIKIVATNDSHFTNKEDAISHDALLCLQTNKFVKDYPRLHFTGTEYLKNGFEMSLLFSDHLDEETIKQAVLITPLEIAEKIKDYKILSNTYTRLPEYPINPNHTKESFLSELVWKGIKQRYGEINSEIKERTEHELEVIFNLGFANYFLIVWDFIKFAKDNKIAVGPGRGSAAGSIVAYALNITDIDPLRYDLLFERFLNPERKALPDIDTDFCIERRDEVLEYVRKKYGNDRVAQIITFNKLASRAVIKDMARVLDYPYSESEKIAKLIPVVRGKPRELAWMKENHSEFTHQYKSSADFKEIITLAEKLEGINKTFGVHAAGVVISDKPLDEIVPLSKNNEGTTITQYSMDDLAYLGLLKMDFLGLRNLTMLNKAIEIIKQTRNISIDLNSIPLNDEKVFKMISDGHLAGVFQLETSSGMRQVARDMKPSTIEDLSALIALFRPGPLDTGMINEFIDRKNGRKEIRYLLPELEPILKDTYGSIVYQEQIMQIAQKLAGFTLGEADLLRQAMGKKKPKEMAKYRLKFIDGFKRNKHDSRHAEEIYDMMVSFAEYCFNKSHSAAYGMLTYQTAYLKTNYPIEYMTALLSSVKDDQDKLKYYMAECKKMSILIMPPDINLSGVNFTSDTKNNSIRFGLTAIKNIGEGAVNEIIKARAENGSFNSLNEFCNLVDLRVINKKALESLIKSGAFDSLKETRKHMVESIDEIISLAQKRKETILSGQLNLFGSSIDTSFLLNGSSKSTRSKHEEYTKKELLLMEKELTGFYITSHPLDNIPDYLIKSTTCNIAELQEIPDNSEIILIAVISNVNKKLTKANKIIGIVQLEDIYGKIEAVIFSSELMQYGEFLVPETPVIILGRVQQKSEGDISLQIKAMQPLENVKVLSIEITSDTTKNSDAYTTIHSLRSTLQKEKPNPLYPVLIKIKENNKTFVLDHKFWTQPQESLTTSITKLFPKTNVEILEPFNNNLLKSTFKEQLSSVS
ncbi:MAG: DNA polymerase III subunit alpha [Candidatus Melainabacteria bacterium]|nr:DNA polymerase III subunit alpha [Candidatus Melainabacteria bacterium]